MEPGTARRADLTSRGLTYIELCLYPPRVSNNAIFWPQFDFFMRRPARNLLQSGVFQEACSAFATLGRSVRVVATFCSFLLFAETRFPQPYI